MICHKPVDHHQVEALCCASVMHQPHSPVLLKTPDLENWDHFRRISNLKGIVLISDQDLGVAVCDIRYRCIFTEAIPLLPAARAGE